MSGIVMTHNAPIQTADSQAQRHCLMVLGMHRSGTSALAGTLALAGCDAPKTLMESNENNEKGYFESAAIWELHNRIMAAIGISWDDWFGVDDGWIDSPQGLALLDQAVAMLEQEFGASRLFVFKDPRICRLNAFWARALARFGARPRYILTHRSPVEVAASLARRDGFHPHFGQLLWLRYTLDAEFATREQPRIFTSYARLMQRRSAMLGDLEQALDIRFAKRTAPVHAAVEDFLEDGLRHFDSKAPDQGAQALHGVSDWLQDTFRIMESWSSQGENPADRPTLDRIRAELDRAETLFGGLVRDGRNVRRRLTAVDEIRADARQSAANLTAAQSQLATAEAREQDALVRLRKQADQAERRVHDLECRLSLAQTEAREQRGDVASTIRRLEARSHELGLLTRRLVETEAALTAAQAAAANAPKAEPAAPPSAAPVIDPAELAALKQRITELEQLDALTRGSLSWRVTRPLRAIRRMIPRRS